MQYAVRLYGPGIPGPGMDVTLCVSVADAHIDHPPIALPVERISVRRVGFARSGLEITWEDESGVWALQVLDGARARSLLAEIELLAPGAGAEFSRQHARSKRKARLSWTMLGAFLLLPLLAFAAFVLLLDPIANWAVNHVSLEQERQLGEQSYRSMAAQLKLRDESESARVVRSIGQRLTQGSRYQYDFHLAEDSTVNAFALPGGIVVVNTGLVGATRRPEELAGVLAHEIEHVELRHSLRQIAKQLGLSATVALLMGQVGASLGGRVAEQLLSLQFTRAAEQQADERAVEVLTRSRIDPTGLPDFFGRLADEPSPPTILSSHPASADRQSSLRALIRAQGRLPGVALDYGLWPPR